MLKSSGSSFFVCLILFDSCTYNKSFKYSVSLQLICYVCPKTLQEISYINCTSTCSKNSEFFDHPIMCCESNGKWMLLTGIHSPWKPTLSLWFCLGTIVDNTICMYVYVCVYSVSWLAYFKMLVWNWLESGWKQVFIYLFIWWCG